ncbi:MAG: ATP-binding cassette domain-containing protein [Desulfovibrionaceae bacterium]
MSALIRLEQVTQAYKDRVVLSVDSLDLEPGAILGLAGPNGAGKSTLLRIMAFLERPLRGHVLYQGKPVEDLTPVRREVTLLQQTPYLLTRSVYENLAYGLKVRGRGANVREAARQALAKVGLAESFLERRARELSGGEAQRVALAARLLIGPKALLLDEPTASLDEESRRAILNAALAARREQGTALCIVSHDRDWLDEVSDKVLTLHKGRAVGFGRINVIHGPWQDQGDRSVLRLADGQELALPPRKDENADALLPAEAVRILPRGKEPAPEEARLKLRFDRSVLTAGGLHLRFSSPGLELWAQVDPGFTPPRLGGILDLAVGVRQVRWQ